MSLKALREKQFSYGKRNVPQILSSLSHYVESSKEEYII